MILNLGQVYAQSLDVALAHAYENHPLLTSEITEGKVISEDVAEALSRFKKAYLDQNHNSFDTLDSKS